VNRKVIAFIATMLLLAAIIIFCLFAQMFLFDTSEELGKSLEAIESMIDNSDWEGSEKDFERLREDWNSVKGRWAALTHHDEIDNIDATFAKLGEYIKSKDSSSALAELSSLIQLIRHVPRKETLTLENIL
jgi:hypothetical protein